jgi:F420H(2)-dependent quinone reductase
MRDVWVRRLSRFHAVVYRLTGGWVGRRLVRNDMLLLTTFGEMSGRPHTVPLLYLRDGDTLVVIASYGGRPDHPQWYRNLSASPEATVQARSRRWQVRARTADPAEREQWWPRVLAAYHKYRVYQSNTTRVIPVVFLEGAAMSWRSGLRSGRTRRARGSPRYPPCR